MKVFLFAIILLFASTFPVYAQSVPCEIDLASTVAALVQAQAAASSGDSEYALAQIGQVRAKLESIEALCGATSTSNGTDAPTDTALTQTYQLRDLVGDLLVSYPAGWALAEDGGGIVVGTSQAVVERDFGNEPPPFAPGEVAMYIALGDSRDFNGSGATDPVELLEQLTQTVPPSFGTVSEVVGFSLNDLPAAQFSVFGAQTELLVFTYRIGFDREKPLYAQMILLTAPGEQAQHEPLLRQIAQALELVLGP